MLALGSKKKLISTLLGIEQGLQVHSRHFEFRFRISPPAITEHLLRMEEKSLLDVILNMQNFAHALEVCTISGIDPWDDTEFLLVSMRHLGLSFPKEFLDIIHPDLVLEGYDLKRRQIFRNLRFMEISNYSLLQVLTHDWPMLFHRAPEITELIIQQSEADIWTANKVLKSYIPEHQIRELLSDTPQVCEVRQRFFAPLYAGPNRPGGALSVSQARPLGLDQSVNRENLSFL